MVGGVENSRKCNCGHVVPAIDVRREHEMGIMAALLLPNFIAIINIAPAFYNARFS